MSYVTVPAYHVFMAAKAALGETTRALHARNQVVASRTNWLSQRMTALAFRHDNKVDVEKGHALARVMNLAVAATSVDPGAMVALDEYDLELINDQFFNPQLMMEARSQRAFATLPGGNA